MGTDTPDSRLYALTIRVMEADYLVWDLSKHQLRDTSCTSRLVTSPYRSNWCLWSPSRIVPCQAHQPRSSTPPTLHQPPRTL